MTCLSYCLATLLLALAPAIQPASLSVPQFESEIDRVIAQIDAQVPADDIAAALPAAWTVDVDGRRVDVDAGWLLLQLGGAKDNPDAWSKRRTIVRQRLVEMREEARLLSSGREADTRATARKTIGSILEGEEFRQSTTSQWRESLQQRVGAWIEDLLSRLGGGPRAGRFVALTLAWVTSIAALAGLGFWLVRSLRARSSDTGLQLGAGSIVRPRARDLALRAVATGRAGDGREAVRLSYGAALVHLEEQGVWRVDEARTPREYLPLLRAGDDRRPAILDLTRSFEQIWYGNRPAGDDEAQRATAHLEELGCLRPGERAT